MLFCGSYDAGPRFSVALRCASRKSRSSSAKRGSAPKKPTSQPASGGGSYRGWLRRRPEASLARGARRRRTPSRDQDASRARPSTDEVRQSVSEVWVAGISLGYVSGVSGMNHIGISTDPSLAPYELAKFNRLISLKKSGGLETISQNVRHKVREFALHLNRKFRGSLNPLFRSPSPASTKIGVLTISSAKLKTVSPSVGPSKIERSVDLDRFDKLSNAYF